MVYGTLANVQIMAGVEVTGGVSPADAELNVYLGKATEFIDDALKKATTVPLSPVPDIIDTVAEFYASGLYLGRNNLPDGKDLHPNVVLAERKLAEYKQSLRPSYKLVTNADDE